MTRSYGTRPQSGKQARTSLALLLAGCTPERLAGFTAAALVRWHNVPLPEAERMLADALSKRLP